MLPSLQIHLLVRGDKMRASGAMQDRVMKHPQVQGRWERIGLALFAELAALQLHWAG